MPAPPPRRLALLAAIFYAAHAIELVVRASPAHLLWSCNVASAIVAAALAFGSPTWNAAGALLLLVGLPVWIVDLASGDALFFTSLGTHLGVPVLSLLATRGLGVPRRAYPAAVLTLAAATGASARLSSVEENINLARATPPGWEWFPSHGLYMLWLGGTLSVAMLVVLIVLRRARRRWAWLRAE
jgi:hypothetical protein